MHPDIAAAAGQCEPGSTLCALQSRETMPACTAWGQVVHLLGLSSRQGAASGPACMETGSYISRLA